MKKLKTMIIMEGVDFYFLALILMIIVAIFPKFEPPTPLLIIFIISLIIGTISMWYGYIYCIVHVSKNKEISSKRRIKNILLIVFLSIFYVPIYYTKYVIKEKKWWGILNTILYSVVMLVVFVALISIPILSGISNEQQITKKITTTSIDNLVSIELENYYTCKTNDLGIYELNCSHDYADTMVAIINYDYNNYDTYEILDHHTNEYVKSFEEMEYRIKNKENNDKLNIVTVSKDEATYYIIVEVKEFNYTLKTALMYLGTEKDEYKDIFSSAKYLKN